jgi:hypothetical protein
MSFFLDAASLSSLAGSPFGHFVHHRSDRLLDKDCWSLRRRVARNCDRHRVRRDDHDLAIAIASERLIMGRVELAALQREARGGQGSME